MDKVFTIQYLRALAALAVVGIHASNRVEAALPVPVHQALSLGHAGVDLFFVISGFIMWGIGRSRAGEPGDFLLRRFVRVAPPYWIATLAWVGLVLLIGYDWIKLDAGHVLKSLAFLPHESPTFPGRVWPVLIPGWTLTYEMFFYLIFAATLLLAAPLRLGALVAVFAGLVALGAALAPQSAWATTFTSPLLLEFLGGALVAELWARRPGGALRNGAVLLAGLVLLAMLGPGVSAEDPWQRSLGFGVPAVLIVSGAAGLGPFLARRPLAERLGDASYAIYLFHTFVVVAMGQAWLMLPALHGALSALLFVALALVLASGLGVVLHLAVERPLQRWLMRHLSGKAQGGRALAP